MSRLILPNRSLSRREMLRGSGLALTGAGAALVFGCGSGGGDEAPSDDGPPETTRLRIPKNDGTLCVSPLYMAHEFLLEEGFSDIQYPVFATEEITPAIADGALDINFEFASVLVAELDRGRRLTLLSGVHGGCYELFGREGIESIADLKGRRIAVTFGESATVNTYAFMASILAFVGVPPDHTLVSRNAEDVPGLLKSGEIDAVITLPPLGDDIRKSGEGHIILDASVDSPWADHYCCYLYANREFVKKNPAATKRLLRAVLKGIDVCAREPERASRYLVDNGHTADYEQTLRTLHHLRYDFWRTHSAEDSLRYYGLRLNEAGAIKSTPDDLIKKGSDFRIVEQLKQELAFAPAPASTPSGYAIDCEIAPGFGPAAAVPVDNARLWGG